MEKFPEVEIKDDADMTELERLAAMFIGITNKAISNMENELIVLKATGDKNEIKTKHIQISMYKHAQSIFGFSKQWATDGRWDSE